MLFVADLNNELTSKVICPKFCGFITENDDIDNAKELIFDGVENRFDPESNHFKSFLENDENLENSEKSGMYHLILSTINTG